MSKYLSYCLCSMKNLNKFTRKKGNKLSYKILSIRIYANKKGTNCSFLQFIIHVIINKTKVLLPQV